MTGRKRSQEKRGHKGTGESKDERHIEWKKKPTFYGGGTVEMEKKGKELSPMSGQREMKKGGVGFFRPTQRKGWGFTRQSICRGETTNRHWWRKDARTESKRIGKEREQSKEKSLWTNPKGGNSQLTIRARKTTTKQRREEESFRAGRKHLKSKQS